MENLLQLKPMQPVKNFFIDLFATSLWSIALSMVILPNHIASGGATGLTVIINYFTGAQIGMMSFLINVPLLIYAWRLLGRNFVIQTLLTLATFAVMVDYIVPLFPQIVPYTNDPLMAAIVGGVLYGIGSGIIFLHGSSGGGTDLLTKIIKRLRPHMSIGQIVLIINGTVMTCVACIYGNFESLLYGLVMTFASGQVVDLILNGSASADSVLIITSSPKEIGDNITHHLHRSATIVQGEGAYAHHAVSVMFCVVRKHEQQRLREIVQTVDPKAFLVIQEAKQIVGGTFVSKNPM